MSVINFDVIDKIVRRRDGFNPVRGEKNYTKLHFDFERGYGWDNCEFLTCSFFVSADQMTKSVPARFDSETGYAEFTIPGEYQTFSGRLFIAVQGTYEENGETVTVASNIACVDVSKGLLVEEGAEQGLYESLMVLLNTFKDNVDDELDELDEAKADKADTAAQFERLIAVLQRKADSAETLAGYGINDAYTKAEVDALENNKEDKINKVQSIGSQSQTFDNVKYPSVTAVRDYVNIKTDDLEDYIENELDALDEAKSDKTDTNAQFERLIAVLQNKAGKAETLAGYGINDAYTKAEVDEAKVSKPSTSPNGTNGQLLRTKGDGTTEWVDVIDSTLSVSGKAAEAKYTGDAIAALNGALSKTTVVSPNLFGGVLASDTRYISTPAPVHTIPEQNYKAGEFEIPDGTSFIAANSYWFGGAYCYYTNENYEKISLVKDSLTSNFVYAVPPGAKKVCFSFNGNDSTLSAKLNSSGIVILAGDTAIPNATINTYPYREPPVDYFYGDELLIASQGSRKLKDILSYVPYNKITDELSSLTNGSYTANGGILSGNTVTVTAAYQGVLSNEFTLENDHFKVIVKATFNVPRCILRFQYYDTAWRTVDIERNLSSGTDFDAVVDISSYSASKFRILIQNASVTSGVTNTITVNSLTVYDFSEVQASPYYDAEFETMLGKIFDGIEDKVYTCLKSGGDFNSLVTAINTLTQRKNATLYIGPGEWNIIDELGETYMNNVSSSNFTWGLVLKNGIRLIGATRSVITAKYGGSNSAVTTYFSVFNAGTGGFTLENINVEDENIRYSVHDDRGTDSDNEHYVNRYINCRMKHINGNYSDCIGGGLGIDGLIEITGCYFEGDVGRPRLAYYHGNNKPNEENAQCKIVVKDCYFANDGTFKLTHYGASTKVSTAFCCGNSFGSAPEVNTGSSAPHENMRLLAWNNEIR